MAPAEFRELDGKPVKALLVRANVSAMKIVTPGMAAVDGKVRYSWDSLVEMLKRSRMRSSVMLAIVGNEDPTTYARKARCILSQRRETNQFRFNFRREGNFFRVRKIGYF